MSNRETLLLLEDMLEATFKVKKYTEGMDYENFLTDEKTIDATVRNFEIIGEAANRMNPDFKEMNPEIEWNRIRGFRNRIVHDYFGIDFEIVWSIIENDLDELIILLEKIIKEYKN